MAPPWDEHIKLFLHRTPPRTRHDVEAIISKQLREEEKIARAQHVIYNDDAQLLIPQVLQLHEQFLSRA